MINLTQLKVFDPKNIPEGIESYKVLEAEDLQIKSETIKELPSDRDSIWIANDKFINIVWGMVATCVRDNRVSLAAPQIGILKQFFVMRFFDLIGEGIKPTEKTLYNSSFIVLMNPSWSLNNKNEAKVSAYEEFISAPGGNLLIERPYSIIAQYTTLNVKNNNYGIIEELNGWRARLFLREWDNLHGKTLIDHKK